MWYNVGLPLESELLPVAWYKYQKYVNYLDYAQFDKVYEPGISAPSSGIYRCEGCGREAVSTITHPLPPQNHHEHTVAQGKIRWRLIVTDQQP